jgi:light-regulated signal transduction histidine kinase (bacteriophytochrome)
MPNIRELPGDERKLHQDATGSSAASSEAQGEALRSLERKLQEQAAQIETLTEELKSLSYSVSHDLRASIRHIQGFIGIVLEDHGNQIPPETRGYLERIAEGASDLHRLVEGVLEVTHIAQQTMELQITDLGKLVREIIDGIIETLPADRHIEWNVQNLPQVECDPEMMKVLMAHLISNAFQFTRLKPRSAVTIGATVINGGVCLYVKDNGIGFDPKYADKFFGVFQRLHADQGFTGMGVGLATAQQIVRRHGGRIWYHAAPGQGACFYFTLRAHR